MNIKLIVERGDIRFDQYLASKLVNISRSKIQSSIKNGDISLNGYKTKSGTILKGGEVISGKIVPENKSFYLEPQKMDLDIIFEDEYLIIINKQSGVVVHPGNGNLTGTLLNGLRYHFDKLSNINPDKPGIVHRLDKDTSGLIIIAKTDLVHQNMSIQFEKRLIKKHYLAISWGKIEQRGNIEGYIIRDPRNRTKFSMNFHKGRHSKTYYEREDCYPPFSVINLYPETGRTHQLRVHLSSIGNPIVCDELYGGNKNRIRSYHTKYSSLCNKVIKSLDRLALHAYKLEFSHPIIDKTIKFTAPIPNEFKLAINFLKKNV